MDEKIAERIGRQSGVPELATFLSKTIPPSDLKSLLLSVFQSRSLTVGESALLDAASTNSLLRPSNVDARILALFDRVAYDTAYEFEAVDLAPVSPFGTSHALGAIDQNNVLTTIRNAEVPGDCTSALAIECAIRRKESARKRESTAVRLCASQRVVRLQPFDVPGFTPHFRLFGLVSAGRDSGSREFEMQHLKDHLRFYLQLCRALNANGFHLKAPLVEISDTAATWKMLEQAGIAASEVRERIRAHRPGESDRLLAGRATTDIPQDTPALAMVREHIFEPLAAEYPEAQFRIVSNRLEGLSYYDGLCLRISPATSDGQRYGIIDGGFTNWTARLLQNRKERLLTSGIGSEFVCRRFRVT
jgi:hypothetical protein